MTAWFEAHIAALLALLSLPKFSLPSVFLVSFVSATLLPLGSEPVVFGVIKLNPDQFWTVILVATVGNTLGGAVSWWMGRGAEHVYQKAKSAPSENRALRWLQKFGAKACLLSWLPIVGDPLCAVAGWLRLPFGPCLFYMAVGKFLRYLTATWFLIWAFK
jgi:membrane protein YqaA with SNARE-associated domain